MPTNSEPKPNLAEDKKYNATKEKMEAGRQARAKRANELREKANAAARPLDAFQNDDNTDQNSGQEKSGIFSKIRNKFSRGESTPTAPLRPESEYVIGGNNEGIAVPKLAPDKPQLAVDEPIAPTTNEQDPWGFIDDLLRDNGKAGDEVSVGSGLPVTDTSSAEPAPRRRHWLRDNPLSEATDSDTDNRTDQPAAEASSSEPIIGAAKYDDEALNWRTAEDNDSQDAPLNNGVPNEETQTSPPPQPERLKKARELIRKLRRSGTKSVDSSTPNEPESTSQPEPVSLGVKKEGSEDLDIAATSKKIEELMHEKAYKTEKPEFPDETSSAANKPQTLEDQLRSEITKMQENPNARMSDDLEPEVRDKVIESLLSGDPNVSLGAHGSEIVKERDKPEKKAPEPEAAPTEATEDVIVQLTPDALAFIEKVDKEGVPFGVTNNLLNLADENGVTITKDMMSPTKIIDAIRKKGGIQPKENTSQAA